MESIIGNKFEREPSFEMSSVEREKNVTSSINLKFFRHAEKEKDKTKTDEEIGITETGKKQAIERSEEEDLSQVVAFGSSRKRTQQTAGLVMAGQLSEITGEESLDELKAKLAKDLRFGEKIGVDDRLNFYQDFTTEFGKKMLEVFSKQQFLKFLVEESDKLAYQLNDPKAETYSYEASRIAEIIMKYIKIAPRWDRLVEDTEKGYDSTLKRFLGSHQGIIEPFLLKVVEKTKGIAERDNLVAALDNMGFDFVDGFDVKIETTNEGKQRIRILYKREKDGKILFEYDETVPREIIEEMIVKTTQG